VDPSGLEVFNELIKTPAGAEAYKRLRACSKAFQEDERLLEALFTQDGWNLYIGDLHVDAKLRGSTTGGSEVFGGTNWGGSRGSINSWPGLNGPIRLEMSEAVLMVIDTKNPEIAVMSHQ